MTGWGSPRRQWLVRAHLARWYHTLRVWCGV